MTAPTATDPLALDLEATASALATGIRNAVREVGRRGAVLGVSGGVDSGVCAALAVRAFGPKHVLLLRMPERDIGQGASDLGLELAESLGAPQREESISAALEGLGCYRRRDEAIREVFPEYESHWKHKVVRSAPGGVILFALVIERPDGSREEKRIPALTYRKLIAATNMKQRVRTLVEYTYADRYHYAVAGTPNRLEYDQGFFVKQGDGAADFKPIAHLYKSQVYQLAEYLGVPEAIRMRQPTTDTYPLEQSQEEFYFGLSLEQTDLCLYALDHDVPTDAVGEATGLTPDQVVQAFRMIERKREVARYLHMAPALFDGHD